MVRVPTVISFETTTGEERHEPFVVAVNVNIPLPTFVTVVGFPVEVTVALLGLDDTQVTVVLHGKFEIE